MKNRLAALLLALSAACGGGSSATPASPSPTPTTPVTAACGTLGAASASIAIVNGAECSTTNTPVVLLNLKDADGQQLGSCSGTIIAPRAILTAAHCLPGTTASIKIFLGTGAEIVAKSFAPHPSYRDSDNTSFETLMEMSAAFQSLAHLTADHSEAVAAFFDLQIDIRLERFALQIEAQLADCTGEARSGCVGNGAQPGDHCIVADNTASDHRTPDTGAALPPVTPGAGRIVVIGATRRYRCSSVLIASLMSFCA